MRRVAWILGLLLLLFGPLLRGAEAADDLARELAQTRQAEGLQEPDGGVGDDPADSIRAVTPIEVLTHTQAELPALAWLVVSWPSDPLACSGTGSASPEIEARSPSGVSLIVLFARFLC
jgi:hypothetical protein